MPASPPSWGWCAGCRRWAGRAGLGAACTLQPLQGRPGGLCRCGAARSGKNGRQARKQRLGTQQPWVHRPLQRRPPSRPPHMHPLTDKHPIHTWLPLFNMAPPPHTLLRPPSTHPAATPLCNPLHPPPSFTLRCTAPASSSPASCAASSTALARSAASPAATPATTRCARGRRGGGWRWVTLQGTGCAPGARRHCSLLPASAAELAAPCCPLSAALCLHTPLPVGCKQLCRFAAAKRHAGRCVGPAAAANGVGRRVRG
jgi:hypothetical protein